MIEPIARIKIELQEIMPTIWRRVDVPLSSSLMSLNDIIQVAMGWNDAHLFEFRVEEKVYTVPNHEDQMWGRKVFNAKSITLGKLIERGVNNFVYAYDFGDNWQHLITIEEVRDGEATIDYPVFVDGARRCPPEDVGGADGFMEFLEAVLDTAHEEHQRMINWYGGPYDVRDIDEDRVRRILGWFADRRRGPLASHRNRRPKRAT